MSPARATVAPSYAKASEGKQLQKIIHRIPRTAQKRSLVASPKGETYNEIARHVLESILEGVVLYQPQYATVAQLPARRAKHIKRNRSPRT